MRFAIFDQMERLDTPLHRVYQDRLALLEAADQVGFWCYFKSEHHMTPLDTAPSISTWLAAVAARTIRMRAGSMVHLLPFYHPVRLLEEIAMLDHLSGGRLELGVGRGISPPEHEMWGLEPVLARKRARGSWKCFDRNLTTLWRQAGITELPGNPTADGDFDKALAMGTAFAGTPAMLLAHLEGYCSIGIDLLVLCFDWSNLSATETRRSLDLVAEHVMPALASDDPTAA
jgi:alkanesulfonate monooxygenase SsuD/methylene tetrahydromethanopterin reductase-like flavin-dependent oxidoreductase (luciferase family)